MTLRAMAVTEGKTAVQAVSRAVSHTAGFLKAFSDTPDGKRANQSKLFTDMMTHY